MLPAFSSASIHLGSTSEKKMEKPRTNRFLVEFRSTNCRLERPTWIYLHYLLATIDQRSKIEDFTIIEKVPTSRTFS